MPVDAQAHERLIAAVADFLGRPRYLEVGTQYGGTFQAVSSHASSAVGIDIDPRGLKGVIEGDSVETMADLARQGQSFDLIFIDASHEAEKSWQELQAALELLAPGGIVCLHDTVPPDNTYRTPSMCGDVEKILPRIAADDRLTAVTLKGQFGMTLVQWTMG